MGNGWFGIEKDGLESKPQEEEEEEVPIRPSIHSPLSSLSSFFSFPVSIAAILYVDGGLASSPLRREKRNGPCIDFGGGFAKSKKKKIYKHHAIEGRMNAENVPAEIVLLVNPSPADFLTLVEIDARRTKRKEGGKREKKRRGLPPPFFLFPSSRHLPSLPLWPHFHSADNGEKIHHECLCKDFFFQLLFPFK